MFAIDTARLLLALISPAELKHCTNRHKSDPRRLVSGIVMQDAFRVESQQTGGCLVAQWPASRPKIRRSIYVTGSNASQLATSSSDGALKAWDYLEVDMSAQEQAEGGYADR
ncbi:hypothetical protein PoB_001584500 [Plakobranchus ocellatus]|uniref:Uncharacterized protein n=1 Tax=Plakobranchus ocellatus TaxID=259542 RepID=A0AAV3Z2E8_9GAST|nr:hypothetical protein PoB_001584500 [Plakobranchus ocellatus]